MAGNTNNTNVISAINQAIKAVNDYATQQQANDDSLTNLENGLEDLGQRLTLGLAKIEAALRGLNTDGCGGDFPPDPATQPGDPNTPAPTDPNFPDWPTYISYKCKAANFLYNYWEETFKQWEADKVSAFASVSFAALSGFLSYGISAAVLLAASSPVVVGASAVAGIVAAVAFALFDNAAWDDTNLVNAFTTNKEDIICALNNASDAQSAQDTVMNILDTQASLTTVERAVVALLITNYDLNKLFERDPILADEAVLNNPLDCTACGDCGLYRNLSWGTGDIYTELGQRTLTAEYDDQSGKYKIAFALDGNYCVTIDWQSDPTWIYFSSQYCDNGTLTETSISNGQRGCIAQFATEWTQPFTVDLDIIEANPECDCTVVPNVFDFTNDVEGWYFVPRENDPALGTGIYNNSDGYTDSTSLQIQAVPVAGSFGGGGWDYDLEDFGIVAQSGDFVSVRTKSIGETHDRNVELWVYYSDNTYSISYIYDTRQADWTELKTMLVGGKTLKRIHMYLSRTEQILTNQLFDHVIFNFQSLLL